MFVPRLRTGRAGRLALACGLLMIAGPLASLLVERVRAMRQPGPEVVVRQLAAGTVLVAAPNLPDPNFDQTVVLLIQYSAEGAAGLVLNRPSGVALSQALPGADAVAGVMAPAFIGGPVSGTTVLALSRTACDACRTVVRDVHLVNDGQALKALMAGGGDQRRVRVYVGYAGWTAGQLEREVRQRAWRVLPATAAVVFDPEPSTLWRRSIDRTEAVIANRDDWRTPFTPSSGAHAQAMVPRSAQQVSVWRPPCLSPRGRPRRVGHPHM